jgi:hypothetical protein
MESKYFVNTMGGVHGTDIFTPVGRAAFVYLAKRNDKFPNERTGKGKYAVTILFPKDDESSKPQLREIQKLCNDMSDFYAQKEWQKTNKKTSFTAFKKDLETKFALTQPIFRDGDKAAYEGFPGHWFIVAKNDENTGSRGIIFMEDRSPEEFEAGHLVRAQVQPYVDNKGFSYRLVRIRLVKDDGFRFATAVKAPDLLSGLDDAVEAAKSSPEASDDVGESYDKALESSEPAGLNVL